MKPNVRNILRISGLILAILVIILFNVVYSVSGPITVNKVNDERLLNEVSEKYRFNGCELFERYTSDKAYYISKCVAHYIVYDEKGELIVKEVIKEFEPDRIECDIADYRLSLGFYSNKLAYVLKNDEREVLVDYNSYEVLRDYTLGW